MATFETEDSIDVVIVKAYVWCTFKKKKTNEDEDDVEGFIAIAWPM